MRYIFLVVLVIFVVFSAWVTLETSYLGAFPPFEDLNTLQIFCDLLISASLVIYLIYRQRQAMHKPLWPIGLLMVGTALLGSIALLAYLVVEPHVFAAEPAEPSG